MVKARIRVTDSGHRIEVQRAKFKHWRLFGVHKETDTEFRKAIHDGTVVWSLKEPRGMF